MGCTLIPCLTLIVPLCLSLSAHRRIDASRGWGGEGRRRGVGGDAWRLAALGCMVVAMGVAGVAGLVTTVGMLGSDRDWGLAHLKAGGRVIRARW